MGLSRGPVKSGPLLAPPLLATLLTTASGGDKSTLRDQTHPSGAVEGSRDLGLHISHIHSCNSELAKIWPTPGRLQWGRDRWTSVELRQTLSKNGTTSAKLGQCGPKFGKIGPNTTDVWANSATFDQHRCWIDQRLSAFGF